MVGSVNNSALGGNLRASMSNPNLLPAASAEGLSQLHSSMMGDTRSPSKAKGASSKAPTQKSLDLEVAYANMSVEEQK